MTKPMPRRMCRGAGVMLALLAGACHSPEPDVAPPSQATHRVTLAPVAQRPVARYYTVPGSVISDERVQLSSRISGFIKHLAVREGDRVKRGQVLVRIDPADVAGAIERASAALESAQADLADATADVRKFAALAATGAVPADTLRKAEVRRNVAEARLAEARAALGTARAQQAYATILSPVNGVVIERFAQVGDLATPGAPILELEARQSLVFQAFVAESRVAEMTLDAPARVRLDAVSGTLEGKIVRVVPSGDPVTRRYEVKVSLPETAGLLPGMFGRVEFAAGTDAPLVVPRAALVERGGLTGAFRLGPEGRAQFRWVRTRREMGDIVEITAGLGPGDRVVLDPPAALRDGDRLKPGGAAAGPGA
jgi:membrane fusion protein, multidrug efflux system